MIVTMKISLKLDQIHRRIIHHLLQQLLQIHYISTNNIVLLLGMNTWEDIIIIIMVVAAEGGDIQTITIEIINNPGDPTMTVIRMIDMKMITTIIIIEIIIIHNVEVTVIIVMIILVVMATIVDSETILVPGVVEEVMIIDHFIIGMTIMTIAAHLHFTMIEGFTMTTNPQPNRLETTHDGDLLNALRLIFRTVALLRIITVIVAVVLKTMADIMSIVLLVVGEALRGREEEEEDTTIGKAVIDMGLGTVEGGMISIVAERRVGRDHHPWHHLTIKIIRLKTP